MEVSEKQRAPFWKHLAVIGFFLIATLAVTYPTVVHPCTTVVQFKGHDTLIYIWTIAWDCHQICGGSGDFWDGNIFWPHRGGLTYNDHLIGGALLVWPFWALTHEPLLPYSALRVVSLFLCAFGTYLLALRLTRSIPGAVLAAVVFAFAPIRMSQLGVLDLLCAQWTPFALLFLHRYLESARLREMLLFALFMALQFLSGTYNGMQALLAAGMLAAYGMVISRGWRNARWLLNLGFGFALVVVVVFPVYLKYQAVKAEVGYATPFLFSDIHKADLLDFVKIPRQGILYGSLVGTSGKFHNHLFPGFLPLVLIGGMIAVGIGRARSRSGDRSETSKASQKQARRPKWIRAVGLFLAVATLVLVLVSLFGRRWISLDLPRGESADELERCLTVSARTMLWVTLGWWLLAIRRGYEKLLALCRTLPDMFVFYLCMALVAGLICTGRFINVAHRPLAWGPYAALFHLVPGFSIVRSPERFATLAMLGIGISCAYALAELLNASRRKWLATLLAAGAIVLVSFEFWPGFSSYRTLPSRKQMPEVYQWLSKVPGETPILELPMGHFWSRPLGAKYAFYSTSHWKPIVNGLGRCWPPDVLALEEDVREFPSQRALAAVARVGVRYVIIHVDRYPPERAAAIKDLLSEGSPLRVVRRFGNDYVCEVTTSSQMRTPR